VIEIACLRLLRSLAIPVLKSLASLDYLPVRSTALHQLGQFAAGVSMANYIDEHALPVGTDNCAVMHLSIT
jgi:hypothetical protein